MGGCHISRPEGTGKDCRCKCGEDGNDDKEPILVDCLKDEAVFKRLETQDIDQSILGAIVTYTLIHRARGQCVGPVKLNAKWSHSRVIAVIRQYDEPVELCSAYDTLPTC